MTDIIQNFLDHQVCDRKNSGWVPSIRPWLVYGFL